ncbi:MAG TPA: NADH-quinone oxidoreductase subunit L, partial [Lacibacter sp.]|nr:NADH-quinone oxidoreductase subunit L [Lacibacter sp.]
PRAMTLPLVVLAVLAVVAGFAGIPALFAADAHWLQNYLAPVFAESATYATAHDVAHSTEWILLAVSVALILAVVAYAWNRFSKQPETGEASGFGRLLAQKWYVDELYDTIITKPLNGFARFSNRFVEKSGIDGVVNGVGKTVLWGGRQLRLLQSGQVGSYVLWMVLGLLLFLVLSISF